MVGLVTHGAATVIDATFYDRIARGAALIKERPGALVPPALERIRKLRGPFRSDDDLLLAAFYG